MAKKVSMPGASWPKWDGNGAVMRYTALKQAYEIAVMTLEAKSAEGAKIPVLEAAALIGVSPHGLVRLLKDQYGLDVAMLDEVGAYTILEVWKRQELNRLDRWDRESTEYGGTLAKQGVNRAARAAAKLVAAENKEFRGAARAARSSGDLVGYVTLLAGKVNGKLSDEDKAKIAAALGL